MRKEGEDAGMGMLDPVVPTFESIEEDDVGIVVRVEVGPGVKGAVRSDLAPLSLHSADNAVCVFGWEEVNMREVSNTQQRHSRSTYPATSSYVVG